MRLTPIVLLILAFGAAVVAAEPAPKLVDAQGFEPLFTDEAALKNNWSMSDWSDISKAAPEGAAWTIQDGVLHGSVRRGTWLFSKKLYSDFIIDFEWKLGPQGNSGFGLRFPAAGDPAFDGLEIQMADARYNAGRDGPDKLTASLYKAIAPIKQVYKPTEWNHYQIQAKGPRITIFLNGELVQDVNLDEHTKSIERHDGSAAPSLKDRPRKGHIGFQELSRGGTHVMIRNAKIKVIE